LKPIEDVGNMSANAETARIGVYDARSAAAAFRMVHAVDGTKTGPAPRLRP
jgi:hypothetical protein